MTAPRLHTTAEAAAITGLTVSYLKRGAASRTLPHNRQGRRVMWSDADLTAIVESGSVPSAVSPIRRRRTA